ncbi:MAG TPA: hypothetical protein VHI10_00505 [Mycobacterium sp.]|nr:hypothetical protein [Mycobacterium sp.]
MERGIFASPVVPIVNRVAVALLNAPVLGRIVGRGLMKIRYVGRRSGKTVELPVGYRRSGDTIIIGVAAPDAKTWWRNFLGDGGPITLLGLDGRDRIAHAVAHRDAQGRVSVTVRL